LFPKAVDQHKPEKPLIPNGLGVMYVVASAIYLFLLYAYYNPPTTHLTSPADAAPLVLAVCILFGGFLGLLDDWMNLRWRYKALFPLFSALPLSVMVWNLYPTKGTVVDTLIFGLRDFGPWFYVIIIPLIVTVTTNVINQLGGLNGLETVGPSIIMIGLMAVSSQRILLYIPSAVYLALAFFNLRGKIFVGNTGTFATGITLASFALISNVKFTLAISILPYVFNAALILLNFFIFRTAAALIVDGNKLHAEHRRSLLTAIAYYGPFTERRLVAIVAAIITVFTLIAVVAVLV
jgi:UDP-N-acetylglucosamine--dolichyl-phosphate N-acetylglucosaminephosphotransferase